MPSPFHLAIPVDNLELCSDFYSNILECKAGRSSDHWIDYNMFGHQLVLHVDPSHQSKKHHNFGVVLEWKIFNELAEKLILKGVEFAIKPYLRFKGLPGEQMTMFFYDPAGNALEFKSFKNKDQIFAT